MRLLVVGVAVLVGVVGLFLDWVTVGPFGAHAFDDDVRYRLGDWFDTGSPIDGIAVLALLAVGAVGGAWTHGARVLPIAGGALVALAGMEMQYINSEGGAGVDIGIGLYAVIAAGIALTVAAWVPLRPLSQTR